MVLDSVLEPVVISGYATKLSTRLEEKLGDTSRGVPKAKERGASKQGVGGREECASVDLLVQEMRRDQMNLSQ